MPLMSEWVEITVDEELLVQVVRELLNMAVNPNHVEVVYGTAGRVILAEVHLAEHWYQERLKVQPNDDGSGQTEVRASGYEVVQVVDSEVVDAATIVESVEVVDSEAVDAATTAAATVENVEVVDSEVVDAATTAEDSSTAAAVVDESNADASTIPLPVKRGPGRPRKVPTSASPDGEES